MYYTCEKDYLDLIGDWKDPNPDPVVMEHEGFNIVRDDLFEYGSKARFADYLIKNSSHKELVYGGSPPQGWAPISISYLCQKYNKSPVFFIAKRDVANYTPQQLKAVSLGADFRHVEMGFMKNCIAAAKRYVTEDPKTRFFIPIGVDHPLVTACAVRVCLDLKNRLGLNPKRVFSVAGSGTLSRSLQIAFPDSEIHAVQTGHVLKSHEIGRAILHVSDLSFNQKVNKKDMPPYNSVVNYDAKVWKYVKMYGEPGDLVWNVAGNI